MQRFILALAALALAGGPAAAHELAAPASFAAGLAHPFLGLDHLLAMTAIGLWSAVAGGRALRLWPALFVAAMLAGYGLGASGTALPLVEPAILASIVVLGLLIAVMARVPLTAGAVLVVFFALFHGHAHGAEAVSGDDASYVVGFVLATAALHLLGIAIGRICIARSPALVRAAGTTIALAGLVFA
ncbi:MAG: HupE/UreJ family protein [Rhodospirillales bacterium]|nr:HupE/UreJ family protein [Rhodospirillales bacterium]